ncbi:MAG: RNA polymerase [Bacteroidetes bacterium MedPE-SWsnd-G2]|nr:MAG: RNA polymerase [Bacteroidetes bacterium MedPE-SWsnd-G2]
MTINDQEYINRILQGDSNAFAILVDRYKALVFTLALRVLKHKEEAEEVSQDAFIKAYKNLNKFKGDSKFSTWIYKITYHACLDRIKKNKKDDVLRAIDEYTEHKVISVDGILDGIEKKERNVVIKECIFKLPEDEAALITLYYFEELSLDEIGEIVGLKSNNVKVKLFRIRKRLGEILKNQLEPDLIEQYGK